MRSTTLTRIMRVALILAGLAVLPQFASAQLPIETKQLKLQNTGNTTALTLTATGVSGAGYTLNFPNAQGSKGGFLYLANSDGQLAFASTSGIAAGYTPVWSTADGGSIVWEDPSGANNPNWSRTGNAITAGTTGKLGTTTAAAMDIVTNDNVRIAISSAGTITIDEITNINGATTIVGVTNINATGTATTNINTSSAGDVNIGFTGGTVDVVSTTTLNGSLALGTTTATPLLMGTDGGVSGEVLVSKGSSATP
ncbi:MAG: hypothetical protein FGM24_10150, partial [Candidatus Kapabacteria bacterium]|nr:hypothetical protein [Candidatus Kapabacteria bacterium]